VAVTAVALGGALLARLPASGGIPHTTGPAAVTGLVAPDSNTVHVLRPGRTLAVGARLVSPHARAYAVVSRSGQLVVRRANGTPVWGSSRTKGARDAAGLRITPRGDLIVLGKGRALWRSHSVGSGRANALTVSDSGRLTLHSGRLVAWASGTGNPCVTGGPSRWMVVDIGEQRASLCQGGQQVRVTSVTTGASAHGNGTPTGTWHVQAKIRDTVLYPASGGRYPVKFWVPYDGDYGVHDSPWQKFAYGSAQYKTQGSHGCVHLPARMMAWFYSWVRVGTRVTVHS
jgi:hypothetical protein